MTVAITETCFSSDNTYSSVNLRVEIIKDPEGFLALEAVWNPLLARSGCDTLFLTYEWLSSCCTHSRDVQQLFIVVIWNGPAVVAIAPLRVIKSGRFRQLCMIDNHVSDYKDFIIDDSVNREQVIREIFDTLDQDDGWDFFMLDNIPADSVNSLAFDSSLARYPSGRVVRKEHSPPAFYIPLEGTFDEYYRSLRRSFQEGTVRFQKKLEKKALSYSFSKEFDSSRISETVDEIINLNAGKYSGGVFDHPSARSFYKYFAQKACRLGWLSIPTLFINGEIAARFLDFQYKNIHYYIITCYRSEYSNYSPGRLLNLWLIKHCFEQGLSEYDMLTGAEEYKFQYNVKTRKKYKLYLFRGGFKGFIIRLCVLNTWISILRKFYWSCGAKLRRIRYMSEVIDAIKKIFFGAPGKN